jgi:hypothetical protein
MSKDGKQFDPKERSEELLRRFADDPDSARREIAILPYYNALENEITQSKRGIFVTHYFLTKWAPDLGQPAMNIVLALQKLSDKHTGETTASLEKIATVAGIGLSTLKRWLSPNEKAWASSSTKQRRQWQLLHEYWIKEVRARYRQFMDGSGSSQTRRTTSAIRVSIDDPVHPDDYGRLHALAAERIANEEYEEWKRQNREKDRDIGTLLYESRSETHRRRKEIIHEEPEAQPGDNSSYESRSETQYASPQRDGVSLPYRSINVDNVDQKQPGRTRIFDLTPEERQKRDERAYDILRELYKAAGKREDPPDDHEDMGYFRRIATLLDASQTYQAVAATRDAALDGRVTKDVFHYFHGAILNIAREAGVDLGLKSGAERAARAK